MCHIYVYTKVRSCASHVAANISKGLGAESYGERHRHMSPQAPLLHGRELMFTLSEDFQASVHIVKPALVTVQEKIGKDVGDGIMFA